MQRPRKALLLTVALIVGWGAACANEVLADELPPLPAWKRTYSGIAEGDDYPEALTVDAWGNTYVTGRSGNDFATVKYDPDGNQLWAVRYDGPYGGYDFPLGVATDDEGGGYVFGSSQSGSLVSDHLTLKYDADGNMLWESRYPAEDSIPRGGIAVDSSGYSYVFGRTTIKMDPSGSVLWTAPAGYNFRSIRIDGQGNVYLAGGSGNMYTKKYDTDGNQLWMAIYDGPIGRFDEAYSLAVDDMGNAYITGRSMGWDSAEGYDYATVKYDPDGNEEWVARYNGPDDDTDYPLCVGVDAAGNVYVTGNTDGWPSGPLTTIKYDSSGQELWVANYMEGGEGRRLAVDAGGNVYVMGASEERVFLIIKYDPEGNELWVDERTIGNRAWPRGIEVDPAGHPVVTGWVEDTAYSGPGDYITLKLDDEGNSLWSVRYGSDRPGNTTVRDMVVDHEGSVIVGGSIEESGHSDTDSLIAKYSPYGDLLWTARHESLANGQDKVEALTVDIENNIIVAGYSDPEDSGEKGVTIKYDPSGNALWVTPAYGPGEGFDRPVSVDTDASGNVYVAGNAVVEESVYDLVLAKYDPEGNELWLVRFDGTGGGECSDFVEDLALDAAGNAYLTGTSCDDLATLKYDSNGNLLWIVQYDGPGAGEDSGSAIAVRSSMSVYVTGRSESAETGPDIVTIMYDLDGNEVWASRYEGSLAAGEEAPYAIALGTNGEVYVTGESDTNYLTIRYSQVGEEVWVASYKPEISVPSDIVVDDRGDIMVTGTSHFQDSSARICTVKYDGDGSELWAECYGEPVMGSGTILQLGLNPVTGLREGSFYLATTGSGPGGLPDFLTIKYSPVSESSWSAASTLESRREGSVRAETSKILCAILSLLIPLAVVILRFGIRPGKG